jgi:Protein of unknown function (DUF1353)
MISCRSLRFALLLATAFMYPATGSSLSLSDWGRFVGTVKTQWHDDRRTMTLLDDFGYVDPGKVIWKALKGRKIDGASIPPVFWSFIGGPFEGKYRNASVVHDYECDVKQRPWRAVHRMFYNASRCGGVEETKAKVMYAAVYHFGPRWGAGKGIRPFRTSEDFLRIKDYIKSNPRISLEQIENLDQAKLTALERRKRP